MLVYTPQGKLLDEQTIGGTCGHGDGEFQFVTDAAQDSQGNYYVTAVRRVRPHSEVLARAASSCSSGASTATSWGSSCGRRRS